MAGRSAAQRERLFRDETGAALERVAQLEAENERLRAELARAHEGPERPPPSVPRRPRRWDASLFATLFGFLVLGGFGVLVAALAVGRHASHTSSAEPVAVALAPPEPRGPSYESALATIALDPPNARKLSDGELLSPLEGLRSGAGVVVDCGGVPGARARVLVAVRDGGAIGVSVYTTPRDTKVALCIDRKVREATWPRAAGLSTIATSF